MSPVKLILKPMLNSIFVIHQFYTFMLSPFLPHIPNTYITHSYCFTDDFAHICMCCSGTGPGACDGSGPIRMSTTRWPQEEVFNEDVCSPAL